MLIAGAGGHALELLDLLLLQGTDKELIQFYQDEDFADRRKIPSMYELIRTTHHLKERLSEQASYCLGVGSPKVRWSFFRKFNQYEGKLTGVISPKAIISPQFTWNGQCDIFSGCFISAYVEIGKGTLVNTGASVHHECKIGEFCELSPSAQVLGSSKLGDFSSIGAGAIVLPNISIADNAVVGAGAVVTKDVEKGVIVAGVPAKIIGTNV